MLFLTTGETWYNRFGFVPEIPIQYDEYRESQRQILSAKFGELSANVQTRFQDMLNRPIPDNTLMTEVMKEVYKNENINCDDYDRIASLVFGDLNIKAPTRLWILYLPPKLNIQMNDKNYLPMKQFISNRSGQKIAVVVEGPTIPGKLAFVMHGLWGNKEHGIIRNIAEAFLENGYTVVTFDTTNTYGESDGNPQDATTTNYYYDLEDVISWAANQPWYIEPFVLAGHSLGGLSTALFAQRNPEKVQALAPISTIVSGRLSWDAHAMFPETTENLDQWRTTGYRITYNPDKSERRLKWHHMEDRLNYDLLPNVHRLTMPVLMIVGEKDYRAPPLHQQILYDRLPGDKELHVLKDTQHSFLQPHERAELKALFKDWISIID